MNMRCLLGHHDWEPHPRFDAMNQRRLEVLGEPVVRRCRRCQRVEDCTFTGRFRKSADHLQPGAGS